LYEIWCKRSGHPFDADAGIREMLDSLPRYVTTEVNDPRAIVDIKVNDHVRFKEAYEEIFLAEWDARRTELAEELGVDTWEEINYEGMSEIHGFGKSYRRGKQRGGLKILFKDSLGRKLAFIWMRGSGTEPVFRVLADVEGDDPELERKLLDWHVAMIRRADTKVSALLNASR
jgi:phosphoglucomutase